MNKTKVWFITGASRGFGFEIAKAVLKTGDKVVATVRSKPELLLKQLDNDEKLFVTLLDVNDKNLVERSVDRKSTRLNSSHIPLSRMPSSA